MNFFQRGDYEAALMMYDNLVRSLEAQFGRKHARVADVYYKMADVNLACGEYRRAAECFQEAARVRRQVLGNNHLDVGIALAKLGTAKLHLKELDDAQRAFREALWIARLGLGCDHVTVAHLQSQIACLYFEAGEYMAAEAGFEEALNVYYSLVRNGVDREMWLAALAETFCNLGSVQSKRKRYSRSIASFSEALDVQREIFDWNHPSVIATLDNLAYSQSKNKQYSRAQEVSLKEKGGAATFALFRPLLTSSCC
jgi:tetratricopeptide (TPR) repeat protein